MQLDSGLITLSGLGAAGANSIFDANMQRLDRLAHREHITFIMPGVAVAAVTFGRMKFPYAVAIERLTIQAYAEPTVAGQSLIVQPLKDGADNGATKELMAGQTWVQHTYPDLTVQWAIDEEVGVKFTQVGSPGTEGYDVSVILTLRKILL